MRYDLDLDLYIYVHLQYRETVKNYMSAVNIVRQIVSNNAVAVFTKSWCPYCKATRSLLDEQGAKYYVMELDQVDNGSEIQDALQQETGQRSVPNVFIKGKHIGGNSDLQRKKDQLPQMLRDAGALH